MFVVIINLEVFKINRYQAPFIKSPCPTNVMTGCNIASVVELSSTGERVESQIVTIPSPFPEIMYCPDLYQKNFKQGLEWGEQVEGGGGGKGWGLETGKETAESKNVKQEMCCRNTKFVFSAIITYPKKKVFSSNIGTPKSRTLTLEELSLNVVIIQLCKAPFWNKLSNLTIHAQCPQIQPKGQEAQPADHKQLPLSSSASLISFSLGTSMNSNHLSAGCCWSLFMS